MQTGVNITGGSITGMSSPTANSDVTTKLYVDSIAAAGIAYHTPVRLCTTGALSAAYSNGTSGVGATLTNNSTQAALTIDGVLTQTNDRILVDQQSNSAHNGIYTVTTVGSGAANWVLTRATDADSYENTGSTGLGQGSAVFVSAGSANAGELHVCNVVGVITFGTTNITFVLVADNSFYTAGAGITLTGNQFSIDTATSNAITANTAKVTNATHTGEVTGSGALTIADNIVDEANLKVSNSPTNGYFLSAQSGNTGGLTWAAAGASLYNANESSPAGQPNATGANAVAIGDSAAASGNDSIAIGENTVASGTQSISLGYNAKSGYQSIAGPNSNASGGNAVAFGINSDSTSYGAKGDFSFASGFRSTAGGDNSISMGSEANAGGNKAVALSTSNASAESSFAAVVTADSSPTYGASGTGSIAMGYLSQASGNNSNAIGGLSPQATATYASVFGGVNNDASAIGATAIGGHTNTADGQYSFAAGQRSHTGGVYGRSVYGSGFFGSNGDAQGSKYILRGETTSANARPITTNGSPTASATNQVIAATDTCVTFHGTVVAMQNGAQAHAGWEIKGMLVNDGGTTTLALGNVSDMAATNASNWVVALSADNTNNALKIQVTGEASHNIRWVANVHTAEVTYA
jgi:hypothetical protein